MLYVSILQQIFRMSFFKVFCSFILFVIFSYGLRLGFILESRITGSVFNSSLSVVSIGLWEACFVVVQAYAFSSSYPQLEDN